MGTLTRKFTEVLFQLCTIEQGETLIAAVSGGPDSVCLLDLLREQAAKGLFHLVVAHLNHGLRPEAEDEAVFVRRLAERWGIPVVLGKIDLNAVCRRERLSKQVAARQERYRFLEEVADERGARWIAMGHQADDQAETVMMRLLRGSGGHGLAGIPIMREERFIRPLLPVTRTEILKHLQERKIPFVEDPSNTDRKYTRNRIRHELIPLLESYNPRIRQTLCREARILRDDDRFIEEALKKHLPTLICRFSEGLVLRLRELRVLHPALARRAVRFAIRESRGDLEGISERQIQSILSLAERPVSAKHPLPGGFMVERGHDRLLFYRVSSQTLQSAPVVLSGPGEKTLPAHSLKIVLEVIEAPVRGPTSPQEALLDLDKVTFPLLLRPRSPGDRFYPSGMIGSKKLQDFFVDQKVPRLQRERIPILASADGVLWVVGYRQDRRFSADAQSRKVLRVKVAGLTPLEEGN